jgi:hypothetical protein
MSDRQKEEDYYQCVGSAFLDHAGVRMDWKRAPMNEAPYPDGMGFNYVWHVTLEKDGCQVQVISLINNEHSRPLALHVLLSFYDVLQDLGEKRMLEEWIAWHIKQDSNSYEARTAQEGDPGGYLPKRFAYLMATYKTLQSIFDEAHLAILQEFLFRYACHDWPWQVENRLL